MAWDHLSINKPHLAYLILGGFTSLFMLCSSFIKERMYIGEATVATLCGVIFGPHAAGLIDPSTWGNTDQITLEFSRIVLVVQCFAVGVELPKYYMEKHWRSVVFLLVPVMTFGWLVTSLFIWWMVDELDWLESLCVAACVTATDPVLASSVVGKGKFAKRVPKHLRDLLSAESGCNDGMAFPFIYLALYIIHYRTSPPKVAFNWIVVTIFYECIFGAVYGFVIGYIGRHGIKFAEKHDLVDRESFLVFYFVLALFCAGSGSLLGVDDLLVGFAAGVGFSNDGWFTQKTEESHVSNVIDLLLNLAYFVYLGTIIPWDQYNSVELGLKPWQLVVIAIFVIFFRRIPIMLVLKPLIPDITTWREALFAGHFGPIGVGAIFVAILARAELETGSTEPLAEVPPIEQNEHYMLIKLIWPITTFLVIASIIVHGSSIAVFTLGKHINTLTLTMSYTTANEDGPSWMSRLPRIASQSKSMSKQSDTETEMDQIQPGSLPPVGMSGAFLRRQREEDNPSRQGSRASSLVPRRRKKKWDSHGPGGPVSQSAIHPQRRTDSGTTTSATLTPENSDTKDIDSNEEKNEKELGDVQDDPEMHEIMHRDEDDEKDPHKSEAETHPGQTETYIEGQELITENEDGDVLTIQESPEATRDGGDNDPMATTKDEPMGEATQRGHGLNNLRKKIEGWKRRGDPAPEEGAESARVEKRGPALAYQFGNTIIVEDADGEVVKKYELPSQKDNKKPSGDPSGLRGGMARMGSTWRGQKNEESETTEQSEQRKGLMRMGTWTGFGKKDDAAEGSSEAPRRGKRTQEEDADDDRRIRFTIGGGARRMTKEDFIKEIQALDPKARSEILAKSDAPAEMKDLARKDASEDVPGSSRLLAARAPQLGSSRKDAKQVGAEMAKERGADINDDEIQEEDSENKAAGTKTRDTVMKQTPQVRSPTPEKMQQKEKRPGLEVATASTSVPETAAERRRREEVLKGVDDPSQRPKSPAKERRETPAERRRREAAGTPEWSYSGDRDTQTSPSGETPAEKRRREAALGLGGGEDDSDDDNTERVPQPRREDTGASGRSRGIRFAEEPVRGRK